MPNIIYLSLVTNIFEFTGTWKRHGKNQLITQKECWSQKRYSYTKAKCDYVIFCLAHWEFPSVCGIALRKEAGLLNCRWREGAVPYPACISDPFVLWDWKSWSEAQRRAVVCIHSQEASVLVSISCPFWTLLVYDFWSMWPWLPPLQQISQKGYFTHSLVPITSSRSTVNFTLTLNIFWTISSTSKASNSFPLYYFFLAPERYSQVQIVCL